MQQRMPNHEPCSRRLPKGVAAWIAAAVAVIPLAPVASGQGTGGNFPEPRSGSEVSDWLAAISVDPSSAARVWPLHERYLEEVARVRDGEIEDWLEATGAVEMPFAGGEDRVKRARDRAAVQRRLYERLGTLESNFWNEAAATLVLGAEQASVLQARGARERALDLRMRRAMFGAADPVDVLEILNRLEATPEEAVAIRAALADHDQRLAEELRRAVDRELDRSVRMAENLAAREAEMKAFSEAAAEEARRAGEEGREVGGIAAPMAIELGPDFAEIMGDHSGGPLLQQQVDSLARLQGVIDEERLCVLLVRLRLASGDGMVTFFRNRVEPKIASGEVSAEVAAELAEIRASHFRERLPIALEAARLRGRGVGGAWNGPGDAGGPQDPVAQRLEMLEKTLSADLPSRTKARVAALVDLGEEAPAGAVRSFRLGGGGPGAAIEVEGLPEGAVTFTAVAVTSSLDLGEGGFSFSGPISISFSTDDGGMVFLGGAVSAPPFAAISGDEFTALREDAGLVGPFAEIAEQIRIDAAERYSAINAELEAALAAKAEAAKGGDDAGGIPFFNRPQADLGEIDAALRRCLEADRVMFESFEALLDEAGAERLAKWQDVRTIQLCSIAAGLLGGGQWLGIDAFPRPWDGAFPEINAWMLARESVPAALESDAVRAVLADHLRRQRQVVEWYWAEVRGLAPAIREARRTAFVPVEVGAGDGLAGGMVMERHRELAKLEARQREARDRVVSGMRGDLVRIERSMPPDQGRTFHAAVRKAAWPDAVPSMPALEGVSMAERLLAEDSAGLARLASMEESYLVESDALFEALDQLAREPAPRRRPDGSAPIGGDFSPDDMRRWESVSGRLRFRHGELDYDTVRKIRELVGPEQADRIAWPARRGGQQGMSFNFIGG